jgi:hypothetical protein
LQETPTFAISVAQNTYFNCHVLNKYPILALEGLTTNMIARAHQGDQIRQTDRPLQPVPIHSSIVVSRTNEKERREVDW